MQLSHGPRTDLQMGLIKGPKRIQTVQYTVFTVHEVKRHLYEISVIGFSAKLGKEIGGSKG
jgi:hypothetical protein